MSQSGILAVSQTADLPGSVRDGASCQSRMLLPDSVKTGDLHSCVTDWILAVAETENLVL